VLEDLQPGTAWLRVPPVERKRARVECVRVALPTALPLEAARSSPELGTATETVAGTTGEGQGIEVPAVSPLPKAKADSLERVWSLVQRKGECECWPIVFPDGVKGTDSYGYPRTKVEGKYVKTYHLVYEAEHGELGEGEGVDHTCRDKMCHNLRHLEGVSSEENTRRRHEWARRHERARANRLERERAQEDESAAEGKDEDEAPDGLEPTAMEADQFSIAMVDGVDRPAVHQRTVGLDELALMLTTFEVLADKRRGRCWSPARYADGATSRGNAGVVEISALVFDLDRVAPDFARLAGICWIDHTTWSHRPEAPRWRVIIPLARPVPATQWGDVWRRARAALCPEADPACKDPSRAYWLPSHVLGVVPDASYHPGPLLDAATLPALPADQVSPERRVAAQVPRVAEDGDRQRGASYMDGVIANLEAVTPGGRNAALNRAAWTLGRWIAADALEQRAVEDALYEAAECNGLVADDGQRQTWATIRSGLSAGLQDPIDLDV
jgi:hypothetical protein